MPELAFNAATVKAVLTLLISGAALYGFVSERLAPDVPPKIISLNCSRIVTYPRHR